MNTSLRASLPFLDRAAVFLYAALVAFGLLMIRSATFGTRFEGLADRQLIYAVVAAVLFVLAVAIPYEIILEYGYVLYGLALVALVVVLVAGRAVAGSRSWLYFGPIGFQPSELAKVAAVLGGGAYIKGLAQRRAGLRESAAVAAFAVVPAVLTMMQPDFGTDTTFLPIAAAALYLSDVPLERILKWTGLAAAAFLVLFALGWLTFFKPYQKDRILTFINPGLDPRGAGYQVNQARIAVGSGEVTGKGLYSGTQNRLNFLPAPHTDFIYGVIAEETGFIGSMGVLLGFLALLARFLSAVRQARDPEGRYLALAAFAVVLYHVLINVGMVLGLLPTTGIPLPFLSYGGSFLMTMSLMTGLAVNVHLRRFAA